MRFAFFTPIIARSAIGRMAALVAAQLARQGHDVTVIRTERVCDQYGAIHNFQAHVLQWQDFEQVKRLVNEVDSIVHQIGNNYELHAGSLEWLPLEGGIVCLHDYFLGHLFCGWSTKRPEQAVALVRAWYGEQVSQDYFASARQFSFVTDTHEKAPMTEWIAGMADAVVTHSSWAVDRVLSSCGGPVQVVPLPYDVRAPKEAAEARLHDGPHAFTVLTFGDLNENKRADSVIRAIGSSIVLKHAVVYQLVGRIDPLEAERLRALALLENVQLEITGPVDDATLYSAIENADIISCLRTPVLEAASASAIEAMLCGKPILVCDAGFYREIPDECAVKISLSEEHDDLRRAMEELYLDSDLRSNLGFQAAKWACGTFSARQYAKTLIDISSTAAIASPIRLASREFASAWRCWSNDVSILLNAYTTGPLRLFDSSLTKDGPTKTVENHPVCDISNPSTPIIFIHIPKTAGTSLTQYICSNISNPKLIAKPFYGDLSTIDLKNPELKFFYGHFCFSDVCCGKSALYLTFLRDPLSRVISQYRSWREPSNLTQAWISAMPEEELAAVRFTQSASLQEFILSDNPHVVKQIENVQTKFLSDPSAVDDLESAITNLHERFCYFGIVEMFRESIELFRLRFQNSIPYSLPPTAENRSTQERVNLSGAALGRFRKLNEKDYELYANATRRLRELICEYRIPVSY